jgi:hypothetical protein
MKEIDIITKIRKWLLVPNIFGKKLHNFSKGMELIEAVYLPDVLSFKQH